MSWADRIRALRQRLGQSQDLFAKVLGLKTRGAVSKLESGVKKPTETMCRLVEELEKNLETASR